MDALEHLAASVRRLIDLTVTTAAPPEVLAAAAASLDGVVATLRPFVPSPLPPRHTGGLGSGAPNDVFPYDGVLGRLNPLAPPVRVDWQDPVAIGHARFGTPYEGPPDCVHGGVVAAVFDQVLNVANLMRGTPGPTACLEIRYRRPTPLHANVRFEGWQERVEGRDVHTVGRLVVGDEVTAEARGRFVRLPPDEVVRMLARRRGG